MISGSLYALLAGFLGAAASLSAKLSLGADYLTDLCESGLSSWTETHDGPPVCDWLPNEWTGEDIKRFFIADILICYSGQGTGVTSEEMGFHSPLFLSALHIPLRLLCGVLLFTCNAVMWTFFSKALRHCSSSARATVTTTASNFISSAVMGRVIFGESHAALWWVGISLTLCGLLLLHGSSPQTLSQEQSKKDT